MSNDHGHLDRIGQLIEIGIALSAEKDINSLLEQILLGAKAITNADGGTLYSVNDEDRSVKMEIVRTDSLNFSMGGTTGKAIPFPPIALYREDGTSNNQNIVTFAVLNDCTVNIPDAYNAEGFDFSGTRRFDENTGYRSTSFLTVPLKNHEGDIIAVLQLLNAQDPETKAIIPFTAEAQRLAESLASQAAIALTNRRLIDSLKTLLESLIQLVATAIDEKSPYTGGHCRRVPVITMLLADAAAADANGPLAGFSMTDEERYELEMAAWLHDCGKITTPEYVVDKSTKLETIYDRIHVIEGRYEILRRDAEIALLKARLAGSDKAAEAERQYQATLAEFDDELAFLRTANIGGEFMSEEKKARVAEIAARRIVLAGVERPLLDDDEVYNLTIEKGTLTNEERQIINNHIVATIHMLEKLPLPKHLRHVPEYAGGHHEKMDGTGYPRGLTRDQMSVQARIMAIADIFEALTAKDRPYKEGKKLSEALRILGFMKKDNHIDPDLFDIFIRERVFEKYAQEYLDPAQIDEVDVSKIPGYESSAA